MVDRSSLFAPRRTGLQWFLVVAVWGLLTMVFGVNVYRAATQSITHDEALTYHHYVDVPFYQIFTHFNANNHLVNSLLCRLSIGLLGTSELTMRLPSLFGGLLYLLAAYRLCELVFGRGIWLLLAVATLCLNPFVLDYLSVARGYGLALGFYLWGLFHLSKYLHLSLVGNTETAIDSRRLVVASVCLALAVHSSLTFALISTTLAVTFIALVLANGQSSSGDAARRRLLQDLKTKFVRPGLIVFGLLAIPLIKARPHHFYAGATTLTASLRSLFEASFAHHHTREPLDTAGESFDRLLGLLSTWGVAAACLVIGGVTCYLLVRLKKSRWRLGEFSQGARLLLLLGPSLLSACGAIVLLHTVVGMKYPWERTGVFLVPAFSLCVVSIVSFSSRIAPLRRTLAAPGFAVLLLVVLQFVVQFHASSYRTWRYDSATHRIFEVIRDQAIGLDRRVRVASHGLYAPSLNFYRKQAGEQWIENIEYKSDHGSYDIGVYPITELFEPEQANTLFRDDESGTIVVIGHTRLRDDRPVQLSDKDTLEHASVRH